MLVTHFMEEVQWAELVRVMRYLSEGRPVLTAAALEELSGRREQASLTPVSSRCCALSPPVPRIAPPPSSTHVDGLTDGGQTTANQPARLSPGALRQRS